MAEKKRIVTIPIAGGGSITIEDVDINVEAAVKYIAKHGIYSLAVHATSLTRPVFLKLSDLSLYANRVMANRHNYGIDYKEFAPLYETMDDIVKRIDNLFNYYQQLRRQIENERRGKNER